MKEFYKKQKIQFNIELGIKVSLWPIFTGISAEPLIIINTELNLYPLSISSS